MSDEAAQTSKEQRTYVLDASHSQEDMLATATNLDRDVGIGEGYRRGREERALESPELIVLFLELTCSHHCDDSAEREGTESAE